ncbi:protein BatD [bacterium]|nr:protein BatD [bacterium]
MVKKLTHILIIATVFIASTITLNARELTIQARVSQKSISLNGRMIYELVINGDDFTGIGDPVLPDLAGIFDVVSSESSQKYTWVNGAMSYSIIKKFTMIPVKSGDFVISGSQLKVGKTTITSNTIEISITPASKTTSPSTSRQTSSSPSVSVSSVKQARGNVFIQGSLNKSTAYVGEQITYILRFYRHIQFIENIQYGAPKFDGFWIEDLDRSEKQSVESIDSRRFYVFELSKKAIFPLKSGKSTIDGAKAGYDIVGFFGQSRVIEAPALYLNVLPLPEKDKPTTFDGLVGDFNIQSTVNVTEVTDGSPISLKITLTGKGNMKSVNKLDFTAPPELKIYQSDIKDTVLSKTDFKVRREFEYIVVPKASGEFRIPSLSLSFFSPQSKTYKTITTESIPIKVSGVKVVQSNKKDSSIQRIQSDIRYLKSISELTPRRPILSSAWFWIAVCLNLALSLIGFMSLATNKLFKKNGKDKLKQQAKEIADKKISGLSNELDSKSKITMCQTIMLDYLSNKIGSSFLGMTEIEIKETLKLNNLDDMTIISILTCLEELSMAAFAPTSQSKTDIENLIEKVTSTIHGIEGEIK